MREIKFSLRIHGELPAFEEMTKIFGRSPTNTYKKGEKRKVLRSNVELIQPTNIWIFDFFEIEYNDNYSLVVEPILQVVKELESMSEALMWLNQYNCQKNLYISATLEDEGFFLMQGGFGLPIELIKASAKANVDIQVSIMLLTPKEFLDNDNK